MVVIWIGSDEHLGANEEATYKVVLYIWKLSYERRLAGTKQL